MGVEAIPRAVKNALLIFPISVREQPRPAARGLVQILILQPLAVALATSLFVLFKSLFYGIGFILTPDSKFYLVLGLNADMLCGRMYQFDH